ncbi:TIGR00266 family protein [Aporhodopirellula aestuarii]|uniref:TIGR00266 family protein n=1 Tax=Aporhodopirellula aestuarii TaxID=2950107 RepID=A0ABT0U4G4_9BACT|nr:TIGR00266 family protein [Aporhodopirellula aestuarii]MCM2371440.1 TIGR00266 family protein [Aporhodopirellula aestuarii]
MQFQVQHSPVFSTLEISLAQNEFVVAQPNSMLTMTAGIGISAHIGRQSPKDNVAVDSDTSRDSAPNTGGVRSAKPKRKHSWTGGFKSLLGGESFFTAEFRAKSDGETVVLAPESYGDIVVLNLGGETGFYLTRGSYLANTGQTDIRTIYGGLKGLMSKKGLFLMHASGAGHVFCQSYGSVVHRELAADETIFVDNRFMVAFSDTVTYKLVKATESVRDSLMSGEGLVNRYTGPGHVYYQTRGRPSGGFLSVLLDAFF